VENTSRFFLQENEIVKLSGEKNQKNQFLAARKNSENQ
jgi:hypothetical protein